MNENEIKTINRVAYTLTFLLWWYDLKGIKNGN